MRSSLFLTASLLLASTTRIAASQSRRPQRTQFFLPAKRTVRLPSPDHRWALISSPFQLNAESILTLEDQRSGRKLWSKQIERSLGVAWSPDSRSFFLNDAYGSDGEDAYILQPDHMNAKPLNEVILNADPEARAIHADHTYFHFGRWINSNSLVFEYCGHTSEAPSIQFDFIYRFRLNGSLQRTFRSVRPATILSPECRY